jgi:ABC-type multidrug transport system ATPase subunit
MAPSRIGTLKQESGVVVSHHPHHPGIESDGARRTGLCATQSHPTRTTSDLSAKGAKPGTRHRSCLRVHSVSLIIEQRLALLHNVSFSARTGTLTAIVGPSGAGKSTLAKLIGGTVRPTMGAVTLDGHDIHAQFSSLRTRIGMVPQDDLVHRQLTVEQALNYAALWRLPPDSTKDDRRRAVARVLYELDLTEHAQTRVDNLSGGQRKRASVAMELLTETSLLILDEPTTGLDPALDRQVMTMLRQLADAGRVVLVVTHSMTYLDVCDQVLLLAPGGKAAFCGPPQEIGPAMGTTDWADIFTKISADPDTVNAEFVALDAAAPASAQPHPAAPSPPARRPQTGLAQQLWTIARRQVQLVLADRGHFAFLALLPFVLGALTLVVPGNTGLGVANPHGRVPDEPAQILMLLNVSAVFMGVALSIRDLVGERAIFRREQSVGLSTRAYLSAKIIVYSVAASIQTAVLTAIAVLGSGGPTRGPVILDNATLELYLTLAATAVVAAILGLAISSVARSNEQILPMLVVSIMVSMVFSGGLIPVTGRPVLDQVSWIVPARWGFAATASTADLRNLTPLMPADESLWSHSTSWWLLDMTILMAQGLLLASFACWRLRLGARCPHGFRMRRRMRRRAQEQSRRSTPSASGHPSPDRGRHRLPPCSRSAAEPFKRAG